MFKNFASQLSKALTSAGDGANLADIPDFDMVLHEELLRMQPLAQMLSVIQAEGKTHEYRSKTSHPMGWFEGETTGANNQNGVYGRNSVQLKIMRQWGSVTGFSRAVDAKFIDALAEELTGSLEGMSNLLEFGTLFGTSNDIGFTGDAYQFTGILPLVYKYAPSNVIDAGGDKIALADLDNALAKVQGAGRQVRNDPKLWMMGLQMKQVVDGLQTKVSLPLATATLADGKIEMDAYGKAPIYETDYLVPASTTTSPAVTAAQGDNTGNLSAGTYTYIISSVTAYGEQVGGTASSGIVADASHKNIDLTWTADSNAKSYMIFRKEGSGAYGLLDIIAAKTYDADGAVNGSVESYEDAGAKTPITGVKPLATGEQVITLLDINPARGAAFVGLVDDMGSRTDGLVSYVELARVKDTYDYMLKSYVTLRMIYRNLSAVIRHAKLS